MNWDQVQGNWKQFKGQAQQQWSKLSGEDIDRVDGKREELIGRLQEQYGIQRDEAERQVSEWMDRL